MSFKFEIFYLVLMIRGVSSNDFPELEKVMKRGTNEKQPFERLEISKEDLLRLFGVIIRQNLYYFSV